MNKKLSKLLVLVLALTMLFSMAVPSFADGSGYVGSSGVDGAGTPTGHVDLELTQVVFPTVPADTTIPYTDDGHPYTTSVFDYVLDAERLVYASSGRTYQGKAVSFVGAYSGSGGTGIYFTRSGSGLIFSCESEPLKVTNRSSHDVVISATAKAVSGSGITLSTSGTSASAPLLLKIYVGSGNSGDTQIITTAGVTAKATVEGVEDNFTVVEDGRSGKYKYVKKAEISDTDSSWKSTNIQLIGEIAKVDIADSAEAPTIEVTWKWSKANDSYANPTSISAGSNVLVTLTLPTNVTLTSVVINKADGSNVNGVSGTHYTLSGSNLTFKTVPASTQWKSVTLTYSDGKSDVISVK